MGVTEVFWINSLAPSLPPEGKELSRTILEAQDRWISETLPEQPHGLANRGVALYEQLEDPSMCFLAEHWDAVAEHEKWSLNPIMGQTLAPLAEFLDMQTAVVFHVDSDLFAPFDFDPASGKTGKDKFTILEAPVLRLEKVTVPADKKAVFLQRQAEYATTKGTDMFSKFFGIVPTGQNAGWQIEKPNEDVEEYYVVRGLPKLGDTPDEIRQALKDKVDDDVFQKESKDAMGDAITGQIEVKHYLRFV